MIYAVWFVVAFHCAVFVAEALLWTRPEIYERALPRLNYDLAFPPHEQAEILRRLFVNQGFYNLFLAALGVSGLVYVQRGERAIGLALIRAACAFAVGAGVVLALSTRAYVGAALQAVPALVGIVLSLRNTGDPAAPSL